MTIPTSPARHEFDNLGRDGLAFRTTGNQVFLIRTVLADDRNNDGLPDSWQFQYFGYLGAPSSGPTTTRTTTA